MKGAPGGIGGHRWGHGRHAIPAPSFVVCPKCGGAMREEPATEGRWLVPGKTEWRCPSCQGGERG